jgi:hypothetical protein
MAGTYRRISDEINTEIRQSFEDLIASTNHYLEQRERLDAARKAQYLTQAK